MNQIWTHADLIDLEYCLSKDRETPPAELHRRDRQIYLDFTGQAATRSRDGLIYQWLAARKQQLFDDAPGPGRLVSQGFMQLSFFFVISAAIFGLISGLVFFTYSGTTPVNVLNFLFIFIFSQLLMLIFLFLAAGLRLIGVNVVPSPVVSIYGSLSTRLLRRFRNLSERLPGAQADALGQLEGIFKKNRSVYGQLFYWPLFRLSQQTMIGFNTGLLIATCFRILTSDIAFGWQSTIQFSSGFMHRAATIMALPWSWIVPPDYAHPTIAQIEGSRIILKEGIYHLQTQDLISWWPFLVLCLLFYGILVRLMMLLVSRVGQYRAMRKVKLNRPALLQLSRRLTTPLMSNQAEPAGEDPASPFQPGVDSSAAETPFEPLGVLLLVPFDIAENYNSSLIERTLQNSGLTVLDERSIQANYEADQALLDELSTFSWPESGGIVIVMESWMPPIQETLSLIRSVRTGAGAQIPIFVFLLGLEGDDRHIGSVQAVDRQVWQQKLDSLGDPYLCLFEPRTDLPQ